VLPPIDSLRYRLSLTVMPFNSGCKGLEVGIGALHRVISKSKNASKCTRRLVI
jgi:hypothetical protein